MEAFTSARMMWVDQQPRDANARQPCDVWASRAPLSIRSCQGNGGGDRGTVTPQATHHLAEAIDGLAHVKPALQKVLMIADASLSAAEFQRLCEVACDVPSQPAWNWCVQLGSVLSVATALSAVYVRCGRMALAGASL